MQPTVEIMYKCLFVYPFVTIWLQPVTHAYGMDHQEWADPLTYLSSAMSPRSLRWGGTRQLMGWTSCSREFLREERFPAPLRVHSLDSGREGSSLSGQVMLKVWNWLLVQQTEQFLAQPSRSASVVKSLPLETLSY